jgi:hypothetical protein
MPDPAVVHTPYGGELVTVATFPEPAEAAMAQSVLAGCWKRWTMHRSRSRA